MIFWYVAGVFLTGEPAQLSQRVQRDLPKTTLGKIFFTWLNPGPGTAYVFIVANMLAATVLFCLPYDLIEGVMTQVAGASNVVTNRYATTRSTFELGATGVIATSYMAIYLGIGRLLLGVIARVSPVRIAHRVGIHFLLLLVGCGVPWVIQMTSPTFRDLEFTLLQITNPIWTVYELCESGLPFDIVTLLVVLPLAGVLVFLANMPSLIVELQQSGVAKPPRVAEEDAELAAQAAGALEPKSPWG
jgi:hypothetical protein